jgi:two-component system sensor kinase FixL
MADAVRAADWAGTPLGPIRSWSASLTAAVEIVLDSPSPRLLVWGPEFTTIYNDAYLPVLGAHPNNGTGRSYADFRPEMWVNIAPQLRAAMAGHGQVVMQLRTVEHDDPSGEPACSRMSFTPVRDHNGTVRGVIQDLMEPTYELRVQHELDFGNRRFRELFNQAPVFMLFASFPDFEVQYANLAYQALFDRRDVVGKTIAEINPEAVAQGFLALMTRACESGEPMVFTDMAFDMASGPDGVPARLYLDFIYQPTFNVDEKVTGILCVGSDTTVAHLAVDQAERLRREIEHFPRVNAIGTMAATLAHELNQPLAAAANYLACCRMMLAPAEHVERSQLLESIDLADQQIRRASAVSRSARTMVEGGRSVRTVVSLSDLIARSIVLADAASLCPVVAIETGIDPDATMVCVDPVQAEQVLLNLIRNACEAMKGGQSPKLSILSRRVSRIYAEIRVRDNGPGLSEDDVFGAFDSFSRSTTGGLGIGLSLSRTLVEAHGGRIWAENNKEGGATFCFTLPIARDPVEAA